MTRKEQARKMRETVGRATQDREEQIGYTGSPHDGICGYYPGDRQRADAKPKPVVITPPTGTPK